MKDKLLKLKELLKSIKFKKEFILNGSDLRGWFGERMTGSLLV